jgi:hypothetical protein
LPIIVVAPGAISCKVLERLGLEREPAVGWDEGATAVKGFVASGTPSDEDSSVESTLVSYMTRSRREKMRRGSFKAVVAQNRGGCYDMRLASCLMGRGNLV